MDGNSVSLTNSVKAGLIGLVCVGMFVLVIVGTATWADISPVFGLIVGYLIGNGVAAKAGDPNVPVLGASRVYRPKDKPTEESDE